MIKLKKTTDNQDITFIPRYYVVDASYTVKITKEGTGRIIYNETVSSFEPEKYYYKHTDQFDLQANATYDLEIEHDGTVIYRDKIFVTNQTGGYSVNKQVYTYKSTPENSTENQFKLYS